ncbi:MAG: hypothetical protein ABIO55_15930 [Ginsengibacter sp.]
MKEVVLIPAILLRKDMDGGGILKLLTIYDSTVIKRLISAIEFFFSLLLKNIKLETQFHLHISTIIMASF